MKNWFCKNILLCISIGFSPSFAFAGSDCKHIEFAELQQMKKENLLSERCENLREIKFLNSLIDINLKQVQLAGSARQMRDYEKYSSELDKNEKIQKRCKDETDRIERILEKKKVKYTENSNCNID